ncbi:MAG TPA: hypothetical protein VGG20_10085 [Thermoanaerobaculia bacterium]
MPLIRRRLCPLFLALALLPAPRLSAQGSVWTPLGPFGGTVASLAIHPNNSSIYATNRTGVFRSSDAGSSWQLLPGSPGALNLGLIALDPGRPRTLYVLTSGPTQLFRTSNGGATWRSVSRNIVPEPRSLALEPSPASRLYLGTWGFGILTSTDGGATWKSANQGLTPYAARQVIAVVVPRRPSGTAFAATVDGLYRTTNGGASWAPVKQGAEWGTIRALAVSDSDPRTLYAALASYGIYRSTDGGTSWTRVAVSPEEITFVDSLAVHPRSPRTVYAGSFNQGVFKTTDGGAHWSATSFPPRIRVNAFGIDASPAGKIYVGAAADPDPAGRGIDPGGVLRSADAGATWTRVNQGLGGLDAASAAIDPGNPDVLVAATSNLGLFRTGNQGVRWSRTSAGLPPIQYLGVQISRVLAPEPGVFYAVDPDTSELWRSTDGGLAWNPLPGPPGGIDRLRGDPLVPGMLYAMTSQGLQRSADRGVTWAPLGGALPVMCFVSDLAVVHPSASQPPVLYVVGARPGADPGGISTPCGTFRHAAVFRSADAGSSWTEADAGLSPGTGKSVAVISPDPRNPRALFVGMGDGADGVWRTADEGASWQPAGLGGLSILVLASAPASGALWAGTSGQIYRSADGGATWQPWGGPRGFDPASFLFDPAGHRTYVAGTSGVWVSGQEP